MGGYGEVGKSGEFGNFGVSSNMPVGTIPRSHPDEVGGRNVRGHAKQ
jgi:hypothetical protein